MEYPVRLSTHHLLLHFSLAQRVRRRCIILVFWCCLTFWEGSICGGKIPGFLFFFFLLVFFMASPPRRWHSVIHNREKPYLATWLMHLALFSLFNYSFPQKSQQRKIDRKWTGTETMHHREQYRERNHTF